MELNYDVLEAISNVFITSENFVKNLFEDSSTFSFCLNNQRAIKIVNDLLGIKGLYCPKEMFNLHVEFLMDNDILGCNEEKGYYLIHDKEKPIIQTSSKIYKFIHHLKKDNYTSKEKKHEMICNTSTDVEAKSSDISDDVDVEECNYDMIGSESLHDDEYSEDENDSEWSNAEQYVAISDSKINIYYDIEIVNGNIQCSCKAFYYNPNKYCKHILELKKKFDNGEVQKHSYPTISSILCKPISTVCSKINPPKPIDTYLFTFQQGKYEIKVYDEKLTCTCKDFQYRGPLRFCKHMRAIHESNSSSSKLMKVYFDDFKS